ncbi:PAS domain-containing sensor histidine kinase [Bacillus sp. V33-4]|nr:PAS domain-containing sensor histidine kinase [Bacillus sp. V33-4]
MSKYLSIEDWQGGKTVNGAISYEEHQFLKEKVAALEHANRLLTEQFNHAPDGMIIFNREGNITAGNSAFCKHINIDSNLLIGMPLKSLIPKKYQFKLVKIWALLEEKGSARGILPIAYDEKLTYFEINTSQLPVGQDQYISIMRDVTEKQIIEKKIRKNEDLYQDLFEEALDGIIFWNGCGIVTRANQAACKIFECPLENLLGRKLTDFVYSKDDHFHKTMDLLKKTGAIRDELCFLMPNGQKKLLEFTSKLHIDGSNITIVRNASERHRMEKELRESELKFRKIFEGALEGIILWNNHFEIIDINQTGQNMLGISRQEIVGKSLTELLTECRLSRQEQVEHMDTLLQQGQLNGVVQIRIKKETKKHIEFSTKSNLMSGLNLIVFKDITEKLEMEEQLRKSDTLTVIGELAAGIAHEIRNPMTALKGFIQLLQGNMKDEHEMYFQVITSELQRIDSIINEFLILAKPQAVKFIESDVTRIVKETVELLTAQAVLHNVQFKTYYQDKLPLLFCEPNQLKKVFINIIKNAIEVMPKGGYITVSVKRAAGDKIHIYVQDEGPGIPEEKLKKLGEPFYTTKERGTGLGLMVSYKIIEEHQGSIEVESQLGKGTIFHIFLPLKKAG